jgi:hypothetical protein
MKRFLAVTCYVFLTLLAATSGLWLARVPLAVKVCGAAKRNISPDECIKSVAVFLSQPELCERVTGADFKYENPPKAQCYSDIATATNDIALCEKIEGGGLISATPLVCLASIARAHDNAAACAAITGSESRFGSVMNKEACFKMIGKTEADVAKAPPPTGPTPIVLGLSARTLDLLAYLLLGAWGIWTAIGIVKRVQKTK